MRSKGNCPGSSGPALHGGRLALLTSLIAIVMFVDGYDLQIMALLIAPMAHSWSTEISEFGVIQAAAAGGLGIGSALIAPLGDRYGRRQLVLAGFALITAAVFLSGFANGMTELFWWRLLTGTALGATLVNASALLAELAPTDKRSLLLTLAGSGITLGAMSSGLLAPAVIGRHGWPAAFWISAGISVLIWVVLFAFLPEAPSRYHAQAAQSAGGADQKLRFTSVLNPTYRTGTAALWSLFIGNAFLIYILVSWIPALMSQHGWALADASSSIVYFQAGGLAGGVLIASLMDRWHPFNALLVAYAITATCLVAFGVLPESPAAWGVLFALVGAGISGVHLTMNAIAAVIYPAGILAAGMGFTVAVARLGAVGAPLVGAALVSRQLDVPGFMRVQLAPLALCVAAVLVLRVHYRDNSAPTSTTTERSIPTR